MRAAQPHALQFQTSTNCRPPAFTANFSKYAVHHLQKLRWLMRFLDVARLGPSSTPTKLLTRPRLLSSYEGKAGTPKACAAINCCVLDKPDEPVRLSAGGSQGRDHTWPSIECVECDGCSQNWQAMADLTSCLDASFSGTIGIATAAQRLNKKLQLN